MTHFIRPGQRNVELKIHAALMTAHRLRCMLRVFKGEVPWHQAVYRELSETWVARVLQLSH